MKNNCPVDAIARLDGLTVEIEVGRIGAIGVKRFGKRTKGKFDVEIKEGTTFNVRGHMIYIKRVIDRFKNRYQELIINLDTDEPIRDISEPLTEHKGHGSAKFKQ